MERFKKAFYEVIFENEFLKTKGDSFQTFFNDLMGRAYKGDYMPCRPWGNRGDRKNDGFLKSERRLFQVYAPNDMTENDAIKKIREDFEGAKQFWGDLFDKWAFVHNAYKGIPPHVQKEILDLGRNNPGIKLDTWCLEELRTVFRLIQEHDLESWFRFAPDTLTNARPGFEAIRVVLQSIESRKPDSRMPVKQVPPKKIEANQLSEDIAIVIKQGMTKASLVEEFFGKWYDPTFGERIAAAFRNKYDAIRETMTPNEIFHELQSWAGGSQRGTVEHELAVFTIMAYYFESCDIFEEPHS